MERFSVGEIVEQAVQTEKLGYAFYTSLAKRFEKDGKLNKLFQSLALKERVHEKVFSGLKGRVKDAEPENREEVSRYLRAIVESEFFLGKDKFLPLLEQVKTTMEAVTCALGFEKETLLYFYVLRDVVGEKDIVGSIIEEEKTHIRQLSEMKRELGTGE